MNNDDLIFVSQHNLTIYKCALRIFCCCYPKQREHMYITFVLFSAGLPWSWSWSYCIRIYNYILQHYVITICQWLGQGRWFSPDTPVSSIKTNLHDINETLLKVDLNTITITHIFFRMSYSCCSEWLHLFSSLRLC